LEQYRDGSIDEIVLGERKLTQQLDIDRPEQALKR
jgi:hypothetical protein